MREHGTRACYVFGSESGAGDGCRCDLCRKAARDAARAAKDRIAPAYVSAVPAREHIQFLSEHGVGLKQVVKVSGVSQGALWKLMYGKNGKTSKRIRPETAEKILAVTPADVADGARVPAGPTWDKVDELIAAGIPKAEIARRLGQNTGGLQLSKGMVSGRHARAVAAMHAEYLAGEFTYVRRSRHGNQTVTLPAPEQDDGIEALVRRGNAAARRARYRTDEPVTTTYDDADRLLIEFVEIIEDRIANAKWRAQAACRGRETWMFFPARGDRQTQEAAQRVCAACVVRTQCLAAHSDEPSGIWAGTTGRERREMRAMEAAS